VHYWAGGTDGPVPLLLLHPGPGTARHQVPLLNVLAQSRRVLAPDLMGMGDSAPPPASLGQPDLDYFADAVARFLDTLGIAQVDLMGSSLGGRVAVALAVNHPGRVRRLVLNRLMIMSGPVLEEMKAFHAPKVDPEQTGSYIQFVWQRCRDLYVYFPWFKDAAANVRKADLPSAEILHISFVEHIKMCATSHLAFTAYWNYPVAAALARLTVPTLARDDTAPLIPGADIWTVEGDVSPMTATPAQLQAVAAPVVAWLDA
jgi:pimeloyl-ACP methyl ester carboxylesterase